jgi:hypothetical protein
LFSGDQWVRVRSPVCQSAVLAGDLVAGAAAARVVRVGVGECGNVGVVEEAELAAAWGGGGVRGTQGGPE